MQAPDSTREVRDNHRFDVDRLTEWWRDNVAAADVLTVRQFKGGQSNPTFWISDGERAWVLRKKPPGKLLPKAHMVEREHRIMAALASTEVPVAPVVALCEDVDVVGTSFFVMEHMDGRIFWDVQLPGLQPEQRTAIYDELARVLATLHQVDYDAVGLEGYGRVGGYMTRQVRRWSGQYEASKTSDIAAMDALIRWLPDNLPSADPTTISHGDYRLDNVIFHGTEPRAIAVIDWELSTLGHPLADLAYTTMLYDVFLPNVGGLAGVDYAATGIPSEQQFIERYVAHGGYAPEVADDWPVFKAFSLFRLASIAQGVYKRSLQGNASSAKAGMYGAAVGQLSAIACKLVGLDP